MLHVLVNLRHIFMSYGLVSNTNRYYVRHTLNYLITGPFQIVLALVLLYRQMQLAIVPGVILLLLLIPLNIYIQRIQKKLTVCQNGEVQNLYR